jgi:CDP-diacylglycerol--serine O-phosphatidyltransferase
MKRHIPNLLTLANLLCGLAIIIASFDLAFEVVAIFALLALLFDFLDGTAARLLKVTSSIGKELDSLADVISFGVAPALALYNYWRNEITGLPEEFLGNLNVGLGYYVYTSAILIAAFAAYRLAKFNITEQSNEYFKGLPTPAFAIACFALPLAAEQFEMANIILNNPIFIITFVLLGGILMISNIKLLSMKVGSKNKTLNIMRIVLVLSVLVLIVLLKFFGVFLCLLIYLVFSLTIQKHLS